MKELSYELISRATRCASDEADVVLLPRESISSFGNVRLEKAMLLWFPHNQLRNIQDLYEHFPSVWWIDVSCNQLTLPATNRSPFALGFLNISGNDIPLQNLGCLSGSHIIRFQYGVKSSALSIQERQAILQLLPNTWVLNDDFVCLQELTSCAVAQTHSNVQTFPKSGDWSSVPTMNEKEQDFLHLLNSMPTSKALMEYYKLDMILDDYISFAELYNAAAEKNSASAIDIDALLYLPHKCRLDLSVLLTASIYFSLPEHTFREALVLLLVSHMKSSDIAEIPSLPLFVRTALVCLLRRICRKELRDLQIHKRMSQKPVKGSITASDEGFKHVKLIRYYLNRPTDRDTFAVKPKHPDDEEYSDIELQILHQLPDIPTLATCPTGTASYRDWMSLTARHAVLLLKRAPSCPSLTTAPKTKASLDVYVQLIPLLEAAGMTFKALEIVTTGPHVDGRLNKPTLEETEGASGKIKKFECSGRGKVLAYGAGLPTGNPKQLIWNQPEMLSSMRNYDKPWVEERVEMDDDVSLNTQDFVKSMGDKYLSDAMSDGGSKDLSHNESDISKSTAGHITHASVTYRSRASSPTLTASQMDTNTTFTNVMSPESGIIKFRPPTPCGQGNNRTHLQRMTSSRVVGAEERQLMNILHHTLAGRPAAVCGYSADADFQASFILASERKVSMHNSMVNEEQLRLNDLALPPVLLHPRAIAREAAQTVAPPPSLGHDDEDASIDIFASPDTARSQTSALSALDASKSSIFESLGQASRPKVVRTKTPPPEVQTLPLSQFHKLRRKLSTNSKTMSLADSITSSSASVGLNTGRVDDFEITPDMTEEDIKFLRRQQRRLEKRKLAIHRWLNSFQGDLAASERGAKENEMEMLLAKIEEADMTLSNAKRGIIRHESGDFSFMRADSDDDNSTVQSQATATDEHEEEVDALAEARKQLLKEMGTTKNILQLTHDNRRLHRNLKASKHANGHHNSQKPLNSARSHSSLSQTMAVSQSMPSFSWKTFVQKPHQTEKKKKVVKKAQLEDVTFLTSNPLDTIEAPINRELRHADSGDLMAPINTPIPSRGHTPHGPKLKLSSTNVKMTRDTLQYDKVYNNSRDIEWGVTAPNGRVIVPTWYPHYNKVMYTLDPLAKEYKVVSNMTARELESKHALASPTPKVIATLPTSQYHPPGLEYVPPVLYGPGTSNSDELLMPFDGPTKDKAEAVSEFKLVFRAKTPERKQKNRSRSNSPDSNILYEDSVATSKRRNDSGTPDPRTSSKVTTAESTCSTELDVSLRVDVDADANAAAPNTRTHIAHPMKTTYRKPWERKPVYAQLDPATFGKPKPSIPLVKPIKNSVKLNATFKSTIPRPLPPDVLYDAGSITSTISR